MDSSSLAADGHLVDLGFLSARHGHDAAAIPVRGPRAGPWGARTVGGQDRGGARTVRGLGQTGGQDRGGPGPRGAQDRGGARTVRDLGQTGGQDRGGPGPRGARTVGGLGQTGDQDRGGARTVGGTSAGNGHLRKTFAMGALAGSFYS